MRASSCRWPIDDAPRSVRRRRRALARHDEGPGRRCPQRCPERSDAWERRDADRPRACPAQPGGRDRQSDRCSLPEPEVEEAERVRRPRAGDLHLRAGLPRKGLRNVVGSRGKQPELWMDFGKSYRPRARRRSFAFFTSRERAWSTAARPATSRKSLGVKTPPRPPARARLMIRSETDVTVVFMSQKIRHFFLTFNRERNTVSEHPGHLVRNGGRWVGGGAPPQTPAIGKDVL